MKGNFNLINQHLPKCNMHSTGLIIIFFPWSSSAWLLRDKKKGKPWPCKPNIPIKTREQHSESLIILSHHYKTTCSSPCYTLVMPNLGSVPNFSNIKNLSLGAPDWLMLEHATLDLWVVSSSPVLAAESKKNYKDFEPWRNKNEAQNKGILPYRENICSVSK